MSNPSEQIFTWEGITLPSYYGGALAAPTALTAMSQIAATGASTMTIIPNFFQANQFSNDPALKLDPNNPWGSESDTFAQVKAAILEVKSRGLNVVLKPHLETNNRVWRAEITPSDPKTWFDNYQNMMVEYAKVAQSAGAAMFCVGTEMVSMTDPTKSFFDASTGTTKTYTQRWGELIAAVKAVYSGPVTYAATYEETTKVRFWDKVDYIGVDAYLPMSAIDNPTVDQMVDAWIKPHFNPWIRDTLHGGKSAVDYYKSLSEQYGKQILFTEVGYPQRGRRQQGPGQFQSRHCLRPAGTGRRLHGSLQGHGELRRTLARRRLPLELALVRGSDGGERRPLDRLHAPAQACLRYHHDPLFRSRPRNGNRVERDGGGRQDRWRLSQRHAERGRGQRYPVGRRRE